MNIIINLFRKFNIFNKMENEETKKRKALEKNNKPSKKVKKELNHDEVSFDEDATDDNEEYNKIWSEPQKLSEVSNVSLALANSFVSLLREGCTLPFIARYRKATVCNMMPNELQDLYQNYQNVCQLKKKIQSVVQNLKKSKKFTMEIEDSLLKARNLSEIELVYAPLKTQTLSLAEKARKLGLEPAANKIMTGNHIDLNGLCANNKELATLAKVEENMTHLIADKIYKDTRVLEYMRGLKDETQFTIQSSLAKACKKDENTSKKIIPRTDPETYKLYFDWKCLSQFVKPHQTLALNRGEEEKILSVKVIVPDWFYNKLERYCLTLWKNSYWIKKGLSDAYTRLIKPWLSRQKRSELTSAAQKEAVKTFTSNLEKYLLTEPIKNKRIAGLDPGFKAGCKVGITDCDGQKLAVCTIHPDFRRNNPNDLAAKQLKELIAEHRVDLIGLGNGTACRETETWLKNHGISERIPTVIVPEQGASIYSISKEAQKEHPNMDPNLISALSIARRVLDPMGELIKVDPKNLGVGLYQHDIPPKMLESALDCAVENIVSMVGVDVNTASQALLRRISGLNDGRAKKIIAYRQDNGGFKTREELMKVSGIGKITYQQCAGFLKVLDGLETLDTTIIHPESYKIAKAFAKKIGVNIKDLKKPQFLEQVERNTTNINIEEISINLKTDTCSIELIINAFKQKSYDNDLITFCKPVYSIAVQAVDQIKEGMTLIGVVRNVVPFGCFVDCGVGDNGLIHSSKMGGNQTPKLGDKVSVTVIASTKPKKIQLKLERILD